MKKSVISLMLTLSLLLGTVLGCFSLPVAAENAEGEAPAIVGYDAALVGTELQVAVNATNASTYKLYEDGNAVIETANPILTKQGYDSQKTYYLAVVSAGGTESAKVAIDPAKIVTPEGVSYNASNLLQGKKPTFTAESLGYANSGASVKDPMWMFDGDINTRYSTIARSSASLAPNIDFTVSLGGEFALGEILVYDFDGTRRCMGNHFVIEAYAEGKWSVIADLDADEIAANYVSRGQKVGHLVIDLVGYKAEAIRFVNEGLPVNNSDAISFWEISLSGIMTSAFCNYDVLQGNVAVDNNAFAGMNFTSTENTKFNFLSGGGELNAALVRVTDGDADTTCKVAGSYLEFELAYTNTEYPYINEITVQYQQNVGTDTHGHKNRHFISGMNVTISAYYGGEWHVVYTENFNDNVGVRTFNLGGVPAEKIRYYCSDQTVWFYSYDDAGNAYDANGNLVTADGTHPKASESALGIAEIRATASRFEISDKLKGELVETDNVFAGETFVAGANTGKVWGGSYANITDGNDSTVVKTNDRAEAILDFDAVVRLDTLTVNYSGGHARRCGSAIIVEVTFAGRTYTILHHVYATSTKTATFNLGGCLAESVRIYVPSLHADTKVDETTTDNCIEIREIICTGAKRTSDYTSGKYTNILAGTPMTKGPAGTAVHAADYDYQTLTDGSFDNKTGRFSTQTAVGVAMDANAVLDESLALGELRIWDFEPDANTRLGNHLQIMLLVKGAWKTVYDLYGSDIYAHRPTGTKYLSFDLGGLHASQIRIIARQTEASISVTLYEIELSGTKWTYNDAVTENNYADNNVLLGIPAANVTADCSVNANHPLSLAFDGIIEPDVVNGAASKNRYAANGNKILDASSNQIGSSYTLTIDLENNTPLGLLSIYEWKAGSSVARCNSSKVEVRLNGSWVVLYNGVALNSTLEGRTDYDLGGIVANGIRITFVNTSFQGSDAVGWWPTASIKEITCTSVANLGDVAEAFDNLCSATPSDEFGASELHQAKINEALAGLGTIGTDPAVLAAKIEKINASAEKVASGVTPVTDAYGDFKQANISLAGNVGFNFYGALDENVEAQFPNASVVVRYNTVLEGVVTTNTEVIKLGELAKDKNGRYIVDFDMAAAQMTDDVEIRLVLDGDNCGEHITWSVKDYCEIILAGDYDQKLKDVVTAMLNYGAYAQSYFGYKTDDLAADLSDLGSVTETAKPVVAGSVTGVNLNRWTLTLDSNVTMKLYFTLDGVNPEDLTVTVTGPDGSVTTVDALELVGARYRVTINDITSGYLNDNYVVTVTAGEETLTVTSSAMCYVSGVLAMENPDPALVNLVTALKLYSVAADAYFGK